MSQTLELGLVGAGGIAKAHIDAVANTDGRVRVVAIADPDPNARAGVAGEMQVPGFSTADEMYASGVSMQGVLVCTPPSARVPIVAGALDRGLHVFVEKPLAHTLDDCLTLSSLASAAPQLVTSVGFCHRFTPAVCLMRKWIDRGKLGTLIRFENVFACNFPALADRWMSDPDVSGGGSFLDTGCHSLDLFHYLVGPSRVESLLASHLWTGRGESNATAIVRSLRSSAAGVICSGWAEPERFVVTVVGTEGLLSYDFMDGEVLQWRSVDGGSDRLDVEDHGVRFRDQLLAFADRVAGVDDDRTNRLATFADGVAVAESIAAGAMAEPA